MTAPTNTLEDLEARVAFLEETLYNLAAMLTGRVAASDLPATTKLPVNGYDQGRILTAFAEVLVGDRTPTCPPWCRFPPVGGETQRPANWPTTGQEAAE